MSWLVVTLVVPCVQASASATMYYVMASGALELNVTLVVPCVQASTSALELNITRDHSCFVQKSEKQ